MFGDTSKADKTLKQFPRSFLFVNISVGNWEKYYITMEVIWTILEFVLGLFLGIPLIIIVLKITEWLIEELGIIGVVLAILFLGFISYTCGS